MLGLVVVVIGGDRACGGCSSGSSDSGRSFAERCDCEDGCSNGIGGEVVCFVR